jgi:hypothetical protein
MFPKELGRCNEFVKMGGSVALSSLYMAWDLA